jgi:hypothetical protein
MDFGFHLRIHSCYNTPCSRPLFTLRGCDWWSFDCRYMKPKTQLWFHLPENVRFTTSQGQAIICMQGYRNLNKRLSEVLAHRHGVDLNTSFHRLMPPLLADIRWIACPCCLLMSMPARRPGLPGTGLSSHITISMIYQI